MKSNSRDVHLIEVDELYRSAGKCSWASPIGKYSNPDMEYLTWKRISFSDLSIITKHHFLNFSPMDNYIDDIILFSTSLSVIYIWLHLSVMFTTLSCHYRIRSSHDLDLTRIRWWFIAEFVKEVEQQYFHLLKVIDSSQSTATAAICCRGDKKINETANAKGFFWAISSLMLCSGYRQAIM